jgi:hypothetical protein
MLQKKKNPLGPACQPVGFSIVVVNNCVVVSWCSFSEPCHSSEIPDARCNVNTSHKRCVPKVILTFFTLHNGLFRKIWMVLLGNAWRPHEL